MEVLLAYAEATFSNTVRKYSTYARENLPGRDVAERRCKGARGANHPALLRRPGQLASARRERNVELAAPATVSYRQHQLVALFKLDHEGFDDVRFGVMVGRHPLDGSATVRRDLHILV